MSAHLLPTGSAYFLDRPPQNIATHTLAVLADNEPGVLARIIGLFAGRGYNIDSLTVSETIHDKQVSRFTIVTSGTPAVLNQIKLQLSRMIPVHAVEDLTVRGDAITRELAMVKVKGTGERRMEALRLAEAFRAHIVDTSIESFIFELTGKPEKIDQFIKLMIPVGLVEVVRTGVAGMSRGPEGLQV